MVAPGADGFFADRTTNPNPGVHCTRRRTAGTRMSIPIRYLTFIALCGKLNPRVAESRITLGYSMRMRVIFAVIGTSTALQMAPITTHSRAAISPLRYRPTVAVAELDTNTQLSIAGAAAAALGSFFYTQQQQKDGSTSPKVSTFGSGKKTTVKRDPKTGRPEYASNPWGRPYEKTPVRELWEPPPLPPPPPPPPPFKYVANGRPEYASYPWGRPYEKTPVRELWEPPPGWVPPSRPPPMVTSWYDSGKRLAAEPPSTPAPAPAPAPVSKEMTPAVWFQSLLDGSLFKPLAAEPTYPSYGRPEYASNPWGRPYEKTPVRELWEPPPPPPPQDYKYVANGRPEYASNPWGRPYEKTPVREQWEPPPGWVPPSRTEASEGSVKSWYDSGKRL